MKAKRKFTKLNYCQYLLSSQINYTITNLAEHLEAISHDKINRYLLSEKLSPRLLWDNVKEVIEIDEEAYLIFDDTVIDKRYSIDLLMTQEVNKIINKLKSYLGMKLS